MCSFNSNLRKKGFTGKVDVDYSAGKLSLEVTTADGSNQAVTDTRALSGRAAGRACVRAAFDSSLAYSAFVVGV